MSERTDERSAEGDEVDVDDLFDSGGNGDAGASDDVGFDDDELGVDVEALTGDPDTGGSPGSGTVGSDTVGSDTAGSGTAERGSRGSGASGGSLLGGLSRFRPSIGVPNPLAALPSARSAGLSLGVVLLSMILFSVFVPLGDVASILGIAVASFLLGLGSGKRRYLELGVAGAVSAAVWIVLGRLFLSAVANLAVPLAAVGAGGGLFAALLGHYFGRDLRSGLTRDVD